MPRIQAQRFSEPILKWARRRANLAMVKAEPPDPPNFKFVWTSVASMPPPNPAKELSARATGHGSGLSSPEARAKAISEAFEIYAATRCPKSELFDARGSALAEEFLDPRQLGLYSSAQYRDARFPFEPFHSRSRIAWTPGRWIDTGRRVWLPAFLTYFGADVSLNQSFAQVTTSGLATGISVDDAAMRAVAELVERDAFMITWLSQRSATRLIADRALDGATREIVKAFSDRGVEPRFYLLNSGINIPVVLCLIRGDGKIWPGATVGLGAHANPVIAMRKAILEQALMGPALRREMLAGKRRVPLAAQIRTTHDHALYYLPRRRARAFDFLESTNTAPVALSDLQPPRNISLRLYARRLQLAGVRVAIKDLTPPDVAAETKIRVVRALATQLQPIHFGFGLTRAGSPRLKRFARNGLNSQPHPLA